MDQTTVTGTVGTGVAGINRDTVDIDLEPAIAAGRAITALSARCCCDREPNRSAAAQLVFSTTATGAGLISSRFFHLGYANYAKTANHSKTRPSLRHDILSPHSGRSRASSAKRQSTVRLPTEPGSSLERGVLRRPPCAQALREHGRGWPAGRRSPAWRFVSF